MNLAYGSHLVLEIITSNSTVYNLSNILYRTQIETSTNDSINLDVYMIPLKHNFDVIVTEFIISSTMQSIGLQSFNFSSINMTECYAQVSFVLEDLENAAYVL